MDDFNGGGRDQMLEMFLYETNQLLEQLEQIMLDTERDNSLSEENINEIFRIMHTTKGSSAMMGFNNISKVTHALEDVFFFIRANGSSGLDISRISDFVLAVSDFVKAEIEKIEKGGEADGDENGLIDKLEAYLTQISPQEQKAKQPTEKPDVPKAKQTRRANTGEKRYEARLEFEKDTQLVNIRAFTIFNNLQKITGEIFSDPDDLVNATSDAILSGGVRMFFSSSKPENALRAAFEDSLYLKSYTLNQVDDYDEKLEKLGLLKSEKSAPGADKAEAEAAPAKAAESAKPAALQVKNDVQTEAPAKTGSSVQQQKSSRINLISVNLNKLDRLMDIVGEIVISESMVTKNPEVVDLKLEGFNKAARQLRKLTDELQDIVMSIRMVPIAGTFQKMHRLVRDMSKSLSKEVDFVTEGEDTEVDKNIADHLADPLMHIIRNSMDHGIESAEERLASGKPEKGVVKLSAANAGGEIIISVSDDGKGLDRDKIYTKAKERGLVEKPIEELSNKEIFSFIMLPGFSTNEKVTEYSGRGVGMDVVKRNIEEVGGSVNIASIAGRGTTINIIIPLTLAIVDAMELKVGKSVYSLPKTSIREAFRPRGQEIIHDENGNEMIMIRGACYPILRLHKIFNQPSEITSIDDGILIIIDGDGKTACVFTDMIIGEQQVVVKPLPQYLMQFGIKELGVEGCTILGDGSISLILDAKNLVNNII